MRIYSMTATFGKLSHETLTLNPELNIIEAPNEWGKSTWCAFLVNMLYGIDTRERSTASSIADKERFAPWSGAPMAGRIDLNWNGKDITIERGTRGRLIFGDFRAYETSTGIDVPELNATNCGQMLLGVERNVFTQAGFLKLSDLPVVQNDALRRRLNDLVTTGDESGAGEKLGKQLKELKNKCRYNRNGLLPQAEAERAQLMEQLNELQELTQQQESIRIRQQELEQVILRLENHKTALRYCAAQADLEKVAAAQRAQQDAEAALKQQENVCNALPQYDLLVQQQQIAQQLRDEWLQLQMQSLPPIPDTPKLSALYSDKTPTQIRDCAQADFDRQAALEKRRKKQNGVIAGILIALAAVLVGALIATILIPSLDRLWLILCGIAAAIGTVATLSVSAVKNRKLRKELLALYDSHANLSPNTWVADGEKQALVLEQYQCQLEEYQQIAQALNEQRRALDQRIFTLTAGKPLNEWQAQQDESLAAWSILEDCRKIFSQQQAHLQTLQSMVKTVEKPQHMDTLTYSDGETDSLLNSARFEQKQLQQKLGQYQGRAESLGHPELMRSRLNAVNRRIHQLEETYAALELAQNALTSATTQLQRRFAPRISKRAQELFSMLTNGRYQRITLGEDLTLSTAAENEDILRSSQWRSDGTIDQLYLALRLAVAEELTPNAPLILDDALVRFDDQRLSKALDILKEAAKDKQIILFTCQNREKNLLA